MRHRGQKFAALLLVLVQPRSHAAERGGQLADLIRGPDFQAMSELAGAHPFGKGAHPPDRIGEAARQQEADGSTDGQDRPEPQGECDLHAREDPLKLAQQQREAQISQAPLPLLHRVHHEQFFRSRQLIRHDPARHFSLTGLAHAGKLDPRRLVGRRIPRGDHQPHPGIKDSERQVGLRFEEVSQSLQIRHLIGGQRVGDRFGHRQRAAGQVLAHLVQIEAVESVEEVEG